MRIVHKIILTSIIYSNTVCTLTYNHISSFPYITGETFRSFCDFVIDEDSQTFYPENVLPGNTIFFSFNSPAFPDYLEDFFTRIHPLIKSPYILVTHNSDCSVPGKCARFLEDKKLIAWFALNADRIHQKLIPIPIGLVHKEASSGCGNTKIFDELTKDIALLHKRKTENKLLYMNFLVANNPTLRRPVAQYFMDKKFCFKASYKPFVEYIKEMSEFKFVLSPQGAGMDCHRTWEALLAGCIPIVKSSPLDQLFENLPVLIVNDWKEVTEDFLEKKYDEILSKKYSREKLYAPYWFNLINQYKKSHFL